MESQDLAGDEVRFELHPDVPLREQRLRDGWAYVFSAHEPGDQSE
jgi:hypothetical protein